MDAASIVIGAFVMRDVAALSVFLKQVVIVVVIIKRWKVQQALTISHVFVQIYKVFANASGEQAGPIEGVKLCQREIASNGIDLIERALNAK